MLFVQVSVRVLPLLFGCSQMSQILSTPSETQTSWLPRHQISVERLKAPTTAGSVLSRLLPEVVQELLGSTNDESTQDDANAQLFEQTHSKPCFTSHDMMTLYSYPGVAVVTGAAGTGKSWFQGSQNSC